MQVRSYVSIRRKKTPGVASGGLIEMERAKRLELSIRDSASKRL